MERAPDGVGEDAGGYRHAEGRAHQHGAPGELRHPIAAPDVDLFVPLALDLFGGSTESADRKRLVIVDRFRGGGRFAHGPHPVTSLRSRPACRAVVTRRPSDVGEDYCFDVAGVSRGAPGRRGGGGPPHVHDRPKPSQPLISLRPVPYDPTGGFGDVQPERPMRPVVSGVSTWSTNGSTKAGS